MLSWKVTVIFPQQRKKMLSDWIVVLKNLTKMILQLNVSALTMRPSVRIVIYYMHILVVYIVVILMLVIYMNHFKMWFLSYRCLQWKCFFRWTFWRVHRSAFESRWFLMSRIFVYPKVCWLDLIQSVWQWSGDIALYTDLRTLQSCILSPFFESFQFSIDDHFNLGFLGRKLVYESYSSTA